MKSPTLAIALAAIVTSALPAFADDTFIAEQKMTEYLANGAKLGWLIEPDQRRVHVYSPDGRVEIFKNPQTISDKPVLPGFTLDLQPIWEPGW